MRRDPLCHVPATNTGTAAGDSGWPRVGTRHAHGTASSEKGASAMNDGRERRPTSPVPALVPGALSGARPARDRTPCGGARSSRACDLQAEHRAGLGARRHPGRPERRIDQDRLSVQSDRRLRLDRQSGRKRLRARRQGAQRRRRRAGTPLELIIEDGKSDVPTITSVTKKLVEEDGVSPWPG